MKRIMYTPIVALFILSLATGYATEITETTQSSDYRSSGDTQYRDEPAVVEKSTKTETKTKTETPGESGGVISGTVNAIGQIVAAPFKFVGNVINLIF